MRTTLFVLSLLFLVTGCNPQSNSKPEVQSASQDPLCNPTPVRYVQAEENAKQIARQVGGIEKVIAVQIDDELEVAIQVINFNRLRMESIQKEVAEKLKAAFPKTHIHVTTDKKLINDLQKLSDTPWSPKQEDACKQKKQMKQIEKQMKG